MEAPKGPNPTTHSYHTHFYCAICGGPFAEVFRTAVQRAQRGSVPLSQDADSRCMSLDLEEEQSNKDLDPENEFNILPERNGILPREVLDADIGTGAAYVKSLRLKAEEAGQRKGYATEDREAWHAYDGRLISVEEMEWTKSLRALIHRNARHMPGPYDFEEDENIMLTGKGQIRKEYCWADAYADFEQEEEPAPGANLFTDEQIRSHQFEFNVYQELVANPSRPVRDILSSVSIPFHADCWDLLNMAIEVAMKDRGVVFSTPDEEAPDADESFSYDELWDTFAQLIGEASNERNHIGYPGALQEDPSLRGEVVTKFGLVDYRHSESCNEGWKWRHEEGLHWVVAEPTTQATLVRRENDKSPTPVTPTTPGLAFNARDGRVLAPQAEEARPYHPSDPFAAQGTRIPKELIHQIFGYLSSTDVYSFRAASRYVHDCYLPPETYRLFLETEFKYVPLLQLELERTRGCDNDKRIDYKGTFEWIRRSMRTPRPETAELFQTEQGREWDDIDIGLKNRHRIWKIVCPIAEAFAETSSQVLLSRHAVPSQYREVYESYSVPLQPYVARSINVPRGYFGRISGGEGRIESAYWGWKNMRIVKIRLFLTCEDGNVCGMRFYGQLPGDPEPFKREIRPGVILPSDGYPKLRYRFGRMGPVHREFPPGVGKFFDSTQIFRGFDVLFKNGIIPAFRPIIDNYETAWCGPSPDGPESVVFQGRQSGVVRNMTVRNVERLAGVAGFINSRGFIETFGLIEKGNEIASASDLIKRPSEPEFSAWKTQPPANLRFNRRVGVRLYNWRTAPCEWEIWDHRHLETERQNSELSLASITAYTCAKFLRGLEFNYTNNRRGTQIVRSLGSTLGTWTKITFDVEYLHGERILGAVIGESAEGIHSLLLATSKQRRSPSFGPPYLGAHRVFIDNTQVDNKHGHHYSSNIYRLNPPIIGLHCIYDHEAKRFLQLGLIESSAEGVSLPSVTTPYSIFAEVGGLSTWTDSPLPNGAFDLGARTMHIGCRDLRTNVGDYNAQFASWIDFENLRLIEIFGDMAGIRFTYLVKVSLPLGADRMETIVKEFGDTVSWPVVVHWEIAEGERIAAIGVRRKDQQGSLLRTATEISGPFNPKAEYFPEASNFFTSSLSQANPFQFATNPSTLNNCTAVIQSRFLTGLKFLFSAKKVTYWVPLFSDNPLDSNDRLTDDLIATYKCPWRQYHDIEYPIERCDRGIPGERSGYIITRYGNGNATHNRVIDRVRAYISPAGSFSGLVFSRSGRWETEIFGVPTGIEITLNLPRGDNFDSMWVSYADPPENQAHLPQLPIHLRKQEPVVAIALVTNRGRVTPWFGKPQGERDREQKRPSQAGFRMVGITGELKTHSDPMWRSMHVLQRPEPNNKPPTAPTSPSLTPNQLHFVGYKEYKPNEDISPETPLQHLQDPSLIPADFKVGPLQRTWVGEVVRAKGIAYTIFNPDQLQFISIYSKKPNTGYGILGIGLEGTVEMGAVVVGSVPDENEVQDGRVGTLAIDATHGERIISLTFSYGLQPHTNDILALSLTTSHGRTLTHTAKGVTFDLLAHASSLPPRQDGLQLIHHLKCPDNHEIIGFHALVRTRGKNVHDLALITRELGTEDARERPMDVMARRYSERGWSPRSGFAGGGRSKRALSGAGGNGGGSGAAGSSKDTGGSGGGSSEMELRSRKVARTGK
ncbi:hypothetical protein BJ508DRAFT_333984 [Ascobolus immersus RN42]|uniref:F-box domain-containing protein n=1 Tax=Ascobolus immersus RN42 TaxID=1160509 RepID=A0A3N4HV72_ASCIM|nr:hypothetical protein BJ508DRAFT_333984 [Ascobolus immersus RN42]